MGISSCRRLPAVTGIGIQFLITTKTLSQGRSRLTEETGHAVQKEL